MKLSLSKLHLSASFAYLGLIFANMIWGANFVVAKLTLTEFPVMTLAFLRFTLALILLIPFIWIDRRNLTMKFKDLPRLFLIGILMVTIHITLFFEGLNRTSAINASVLSLVIPILSVLAAWWFLKERVFWINLLGIVLGLTGALIVLGLPLIFTGDFSSQGLVGNVLIVLSGFSFIAGALLSKQTFRNYSPMLITTMLFLVGSVTFAPAAFLDYLQNPDWYLRVSLMGSLGLLYITFLSTICAFFLYEVSLDKIGLSKTSFFQYLQPAVAASIAVPYLGERISFSFIIGTSLIILGVYWGTIGKEHHHHPHLKHHHK